MGEVVSYVSKNILLDNEIDEQVAALISAKEVKLPDIKSPLIGTYVKKIEGTYNTAMAKSDTDHAIELLYIAYNTTPQEHGAIRVKIADIMSNLIKAQQESESAVKDAMRVAKTIGDKLKTYMPDWMDVKEGNDAAEIKGYVTEDLLKLAKDVASAATGVKTKLMTIAARYDQILADIVEATANSEIAMSDAIKANEAIKQEIVETKARAKQLDSLVKDLQAQVARFDKLAADYGKQAKSAEKKAFIGSLIGGITGVISSVIPVAGMIAGPIGSAVSAGSQGKPVANSGAGSTDPNIAVQKSEIEGKRNAQQAVVTESKNAVEQLAKELENPTSEAHKNGLTDSLQKAQTRLSEEQAKLGSLDEQLGALIRNVQAAAGEITADQKQQAKSLRDLEAQMLENVEKYENARREQAAELIAITVLLDGKQTKQQTIELAVRSLNVSVSALKRTKEIVEEIAFFFKSFADFMQVIIDEATVRVGHYEEAAGKETLRKNYLNGLVESTDRFFVTQAAQWMAVNVVADQFVQVFNNGWSKLNKLSGKYIQGHELEAYLEQASNQLKMIAAKRESTANQRITSLQNYREEVKQQA
ncbi:hypothetical protein [Pseudomonas sp. PSKL.D1]|uniref:hypothetical protein n=1 Tax=Pseudomonas sp. PSKL.D1 TaxID=3029060 RepID=UPI002380D658|nr:hypothetical protein [Pseudomonas sp. PSKL.D1]WDY60230.1 hypothetical protein PVV54_11575 [Pseudomonas sp. PSKL.D1]